MKYSIYLLTLLSKHHLTKFSYITVYPTITRHSTAPNWRPFSISCLMSTFHLHHKLLLQACHCHPMQYLCPVDSSKKKSHEDRSHNLCNNSTMQCHLRCIHHRHIQASVSIQMGVYANCTSSPWVISQPSVQFPSPAFQDEHQWRDKPWLHGWTLHFWHCLG